MFGCKHETRSSRLRSTDETTALPLKQPRQIGPELAVEPCLS